MVYHGISANISGLVARENHPLLLATGPSNQGWSSFFGGKLSHDAEFNKIVLSLFLALLVCGLIARRMHYLCFMSLEDVVLKIR
jgi:hypothetical protein